MIPKIIHQTYKTAELPADLQALHDKIKQLHPGWEIHLWTDIDNRQLVEKHFPQMLEAYDAMPYNIMRVDIIRYMYMAVYGGAYLDLDYELFKPLDEMIADTDLLLPLSREKQGKDFYSKQVIIGNCFFASSANHVFWQDVLNDFYRNPPVKKFDNKIEILKLTGPEFITNVYFRNEKKYGGKLPSKNVYHPDVSYAKKPNYQELLLKNGTLGIHHCEESWLKENNSLSNLLARARASLNRRVSNLFR